MPRTRGVPKRYTAKATSLVGAAALGAGAVLLLQNMGTGTEFKAPINPPPINDLRLTKEQLQNDLGIGNVAPYLGLDLSGPFTASEGWHGPGRYDFRAAYTITPYLTKEEQMDNINYVLFGLPREAVESDYKPRPVSPEIKKAVDALGKFKRFAPKEQ